MKPEHKEGQDSIDAFIRQAIGKEPFLSFSRAGESPIQLIQLLHALDQQGTNKLSKGPKLDCSLEGKERIAFDHCNGLTSFSSDVNGIKETIPSMKSSGLSIKGTKGTSDHIQSLKIPEAVVAFAQAAAKANGEPEKYLPGWPLLSTPKVQLQKCDKCSREFCSTINYRRHVRVHRRSLNIDKDSQKNREFLGAFWDKLSLDEAKELVCFKNVALEEVAGSSIIRALSSFVRKPGISSLPQAYVKAGAALLDVVQARPSRLPISSEELFDMLDDASEKTFLCAGTALSVQKFVFDGEAGKVALEMKNLIACTSFLVEQRLVKAWVADKDAEALRCQKLLVEEEEAAQKRQAELLERKRLKKLRQKEQRAKEQISGNQALENPKEGSPDSVVGTSSSPETSSPRAPSESESNPPDASSSYMQMFVESIQSDVGVDSGAPPRPCGTDPNDTYGNSELRYGAPDQAQLNGQHHLIVAHRPVLKSLRNNASNGFHSGRVPISKPSTHKRIAPLNVHKVWTRKTKNGVGQSSSGNLQDELRKQLDQNENCEVLIGSISVALGDSNTVEHHSRSQNHDQEKHMKLESVASSGARSTGKFWKPVGWQDIAVCTSVLKNKRAEVDSVLAKVSSEGAGVDITCQRSTTCCSGDVFLTQRWKDSAVADHLKLGALSTTEPTLRQESAPTMDQPSPPETTVKTLESDGADNHHSAWLPVETTGYIGGPALPPIEMVGHIGGPNKPKFRAKGDKGCRLKYIPKQKSNP